MEPKMKTNFFFAFLLTCLFAAPAFALSPPEDFNILPYSWDRSPIVLTKGTPHLRLLIEAQIDLTDKTFGVVIRQGELELGDAEVELIQVSSRQTTLKVTVESLDVGIFELEVVPSFEAYNFYPFVHLQIIDQESSVTIAPADLGTTTRQGGQQTCCELAPDDDECFFGEGCQRCWHDTKFMDRRLWYEIKIEGVQASVEALLNGESHQTHEYYRSPSVSFSFPEEDAGPYCVELIVRDLAGAILRQTEEECFVSEDFPELAEPTALEPPRVECLTDPVITNPTEPVDPGTGPSKVDKGESSSCSTAGGGPGALLLLAVFGLVRRRLS